MPTTEFFYSGSPSLWTISKTLTIALVQTTEDISVSSTTSEKVFITNLPVSGPNPESHF